MLRPLLLVLAAGLAVPSGEDDILDRTWVGARVALKRHDALVRQVDDRGRVVNVLGRNAYVVLEEEGGRVRLRAGGVEVWIDKTDAVPVRDAVAYFTAQIRADPGRGAPYAYRGSAWLYQGKPEYGLSDYDKALRFDPDEPDWYNNRGTLHAALGDHDRAIADYDAALRLRLSAGPLLNRSVAHAQKKDHARARTDAEDAVRLEPALGRAHNHLAWLLATCPDEAHRDGRRALDAARRACELAGWKEPSYVDTLAAACAALGRFDDAVRYQEQALRDPAFARAAGDRARQRLALYRQRLPYRDAP